MSIAMKIKEYMNNMPDTLNTKKEVDDYYKDRRDTLWRSFGGNPPTSVHSYKKGGDNKNNQRKQIMIEEIEQENEKNQYASNAQGWQNQKI